MESGILFFWFAWIYWIIITFFMRKAWRRTVYGSWLLFVILFSNVFIDFMKFHISIALLILISGAFLLHAQLPRLAFHIFLSFTFMIGYLAILLWEINTPVWLFLPRIVIIPIVCTILVTNLTPNFHTRIVICLLGISCGEMIHSFILSGYMLQDSMGGMDFLDCTIVTISCIFGIEITKQIKNKLQPVSRRYQQRYNWQTEIENEPKSF